VILTIRLVFVELIFCGQFILLKFVMYTAAGFEPTIVWF
jgi:hypothetical protein